MLRISTFFALFAVSIAGPKCNDGCFIVTDMVQTGTEESFMEHVSQSDKECSKDTLTTCTGTCNSMNMTMTADVNDTTGATAAEYSGTIVGTTWWCGESSESGVTDDNCQNYADNITKSINAADDDWQVSNLNLTCTKITVCNEDCASSGMKNLLHLAVVAAALFLLF